ncbi:MAG: SUF system NifU family Fe-S cluster assembly protein [Planctomycetes bacterium]|nr:SUF system NifU family Fe-S cluster assembly protein [Planctomycetota bacterium]
MAVDDVLYREEILDHYHASAYRGRIEKPDLSYEADNPFCGDRVRLELKLEPAGRIQHVRFNGQGCAISQAAASMLAEHIEGKSVEDARQFSPDQMLQLLGVRLSATRIKCGLLAWRALQYAIRGNPQAESAA